ncbi:MAG TPA: DUF5655 domain-containing protein [Candidatus Acidoferrum sp.]|nr:DUF5655 domain-containing protein [Candidatus Acidoferrum sp.]
MPKATATKTESLYSVHPGIAMTQKWIADLKDRTGRNLDEWLALIKKEGPKDEKARREWLKARHKFGTNNASWIAARAEGKSLEDTDPELYLKTAVQFVEEQYAGPKEKLRPIFDALLAKGKALGPDVKACPCKTIVPFYRQHVFAQIKPTTNTRIDLGFALTHYKGKLPKRLIDTGGLARKDRITHRIEIKSAGEIDAEVQKWLRIAYDLDA